MYVLLAGFYTLFFTLVDSHTPQIFYDMTISTRRRCRLSYWAAHQRHEGCGLSDMCPGTLGEQDHRLQRARLRVRRSQGM